MYEDQPNTEHAVTMKLIGVGGAGCNAVERLNISGIGSFISRVAVDTDVQALSRLHDTQTCTIGEGLLRGLSTGGDTELGKQAAQESEDALQSLVEEELLVVLVAGLGGGTGGGAAPVLARHARKQGATVIAFTPLPFTFEGARRQQEAKRTLQQLQGECDAVIALPNASLMQQQEGSVTVLEAFDAANSWIERAIRAIASFLFKPGVINVDFSSLRKTFKGSTGRTLFALGAGAGEDAAKKALQEVMLCPLLHLPDSAKRADRILVSIMAGADVDMSTLNDLMASITETFSSKEESVVGILIDDQLGSSVEVCVVGVTVDKKSELKKPSSRAGAVPISRAEPEDDEPIAVHTPKRKLKFKGDSSDKRKQEEFTFFEEDTSERGYFNKTEENLYNGEDLDVPTYLRKGIKVSLK